MAPGREPPEARTLSSPAQFLCDETGFEITEWSGVFALAAVALVLFRHDLGLHLGGFLELLIGSVESFLP